MKKSGFLIAAAAAALLAGCGLGGPDYPQFGEASYRIEGTTADVNGGPNTRTVIYRNGPQMRVEATLSEYGPAVVVYDQSTNAAYVLTSTGPVGAGQPNAATQQAPVQPNAQTTSPSATTTAPQQQPTTTQASALPTMGVAVRLDDADAPQPMETAWQALGADNARSVGECEVAGQSGHEWRPRDAGNGAERIACITDDGIVLRVREEGMTLWEATSLQRGAQDPALFGVPATHQILDPEAVAEGVGERMEQLDSVTGDGQQRPPS